MSDLRNVEELLRDGVILSCEKCNANFYDDDVAFAMETRTCPYCHEVIEKPKHVTSVEKGRKYKVLADSDGYFSPGDVVVAMEDSTSEPPICVLSEDYDSDDEVGSYRRGRALMLQGLGYISGNVLDYERTRRLCVMAAEKISQKVLPICVVQIVFIILILKGIAFKSILPNIVLLFAIIVITMRQIIVAVDDIKDEIEEERSKY